MSPPPATVAPARPELVGEGFPASRPRWSELATSAEHKDVARILITAALGFLLVAVTEFLLMRLQLAIPENTFLSPVTFNRMLSLYGVTAVFFFALPLCIGLFYYVVPLQIGARGTALPRLGQSGLWLFILGAAVIYGGYLFTPSEAGVNPLPPLSEVAFLANNGVDAWLDRHRHGDARLRPAGDQPGDDDAQPAGPRDGLEAAAGLLLGRGDQLLADPGDRPDHARRDHHADDRPQFRRRLLQRRQRRGAASLAAPQLDLLQRRLHADPDHRPGSDRRDHPGAVPPARCSTATR